MFIKYSTGQIPPKKSRGKGSKGKKTKDTHVADVDVSEESDPEPPKRKTASRRVVKKKVMIFIDNNIISDDPDIALELGKSISKTKAEEAEAARQVHATHARIVIESVLEPTRRRKSGKVTSDPPKRLKGVPSLTLEEQEAGDTMQALKESRKTSRRQPGTGGSNEGTGTIPGVLDESTVISATSSEGTGTKPGVPDEEKVISKEKVILEWGFEQVSEYSEEDQLDDEEKDDKDSDADDEGDDHISDTQDDDDEHAETESDASIKSTEFPLPSSSLLVSSGFGTQFFNFSSDISLPGVLKDTVEADVNFLMDIHIQQETPQIYITDAPTITTAVPESDALFAVQLRVAKLEKDVSKLKKIDLSAKALAALKTQVLSVVDNYLGSKVRDVFQKELKKHTAYLIQKYSRQQIPELPKNQTLIVDLEQESEKSPSEILKIKKEQAEKQKMPKFTIKSTDKEALKEFDQKRALSTRRWHANNPFKKKSCLINSLPKKQKHDGDENDDDEDPPVGPNQGKKTNRRRTKESESSKKPSITKETPKGKAPSKGSKTGKSASAKEPVKEPTTEVVMDNANEDVVHDDDQPQDTSEPMITKTPNTEWFIQPPMPLTPDLEWNKRQLDWNNPDGDRYPFYLSKPLPLQGHLGHLTIAADYFFNNDLEYLKSSDPERTYTTSITKTKEARYEIEGIKDMVPTLWSPTKVGYDKDVLKGIKHWG
ncbi:hypothetical protein Tco_0542153 [Tanacetum coccineum]